MADSLHRAVYRQQTHQVLTEHAIAQRFHRRFLLGLKAALQVMKMPYSEQHWKFVSEENLTRLLTLRRLHLETYLPIQELLLAILQAMPKMARKHLTISKLCGPLAQSAVEDYVKANFPQDENRSAFYSERRVNQILSSSAREAKLSGFDEATMVPDYKRLVSKMRRKMGSKALGTKPYRNNPWI